MKAENYLSVNILGMDEYISELVVAIESRQRTVQCFTKTLRKRNAQQFETFKVNIKH